MVEFKNFIFNGNALEFACQSGNPYLVEYLMSLHRFDLNKRNNIL